MSDYFNICILKVETQCLASKTEYQKKRSEIVFRPLFLENSPNLKNRNDSCL
jgi:hypothetical protein